MVPMVPEIRWEASRVQRVVGTPLALTRFHAEPVEEHLEPHRGQLLQPDGVDEDESPDLLFKRMPILLRDLAAYDYTPDCPKCMAYKDGQTQGTHHNLHTPRANMCSQSMASISSGAVPSSAEKAGFL